jgi:hypothetical protein
MKAFLKTTLLSLLFLACEDTAGNDTASGSGISGNLTAVSSISGSELSAEEMETALSYGNTPSNAIANSDVAAVKAQASSWNSYFETMITTYEDDNSGELGELIAGQLAGVNYTIERSESGDFYTYTYKINGKNYIESKIAKNRRSGYYKIYMGVLYEEIIGSDFDYSGTVEYNFEIHSDGKTTSRYLYDYNYSTSVAGQSISTVFRYDGKYLLNADKSGMAEMSWSSSGFSSETCKEWTSAGVVSDCD